MKNEKTYNDIMEILRTNASVFHAGSVLASDPEEIYLHERAFEDVAKDIVNLVDNK